MDNISDDTREAMAILDDLFVHDRPAYDRAIRWFRTIQRNRVQAQPSVPKKRATYQDVLDAPDDKIAEILDGELFLSPRLAPPHGYAMSKIAFDVDASFGDQPRDPTAPGGWWILTEPELHLHGDVVVPDVVGWRRERMVRLPQGVGIEIPPDWVCEIQSPSTTRIDYDKKLAIYARERVEYLWYVDPIARNVLVLHLPVPSRDKFRLLTMTAGGADVVRLPPFEDVEIDLTRWWLPTT